MNYLDILKAGIASRFIKLHKNNRLGDWSECEKINKSLSDDEECQEIMTSFKGN